MQVERTNPNALVVNELPDGSRVIVDSENERVFALNATAGAAWDACGGPTTLSRLTENMQRSFDPGITEELAEQAILQLQEQNLVKTSGSRTTRRAFIATLSAIAVPLVVSLTTADQRAYASTARSAIPSPHPGYPPIHREPLPVRRDPLPVRRGPFGLF